MTVYSHWSGDPRDWRREAFAHSPMGGQGHVLVIGRNSPDPWHTIDAFPKGPWAIPAPNTYWFDLKGDARDFPAGYAGPVDFLGADMPDQQPQRTGLTAQVAPVLAPATGGITVKKELDDKQTLHVEICVDGKCYRSSMDLAPAIDAVMKKMAQWHAAQHAAGVPPTVVVGCVESAVGCAADAMVGALVAHHVDVACGSFLDDIAGAVKGVVSSVPVLGPTIISTLQQFKGPISAAAGVAAGGAATLIPGVGPFIAPLAGSLASDLVNSAAGDPKAQKAVAKAQQQAATDPNVAAALDTAKQSVAHAVVAHHLVNTAKQAAQGHPGAQQEIQKVASDAQAGDPVAQAAQSLLSQALSSAMKQFGTSTSGWVDMIGAAVDDLRREASTRATGSHGRVVGVIHGINGLWFTQTFSNADDADDWFGSATRDPSMFLYAAYYDKGDPTFPSPLNEAMGRGH